jgi:hypothetical protein
MVADDFGGEAGMDLFLGLARQGRPHPDVRDDALRAAQIGHAGS